MEDTPRLYTLLHCAIERRKWRFATLLIRDGVDVNKITEQGETALLFACLYYSSTYKPIPPRLFTQLITPYNVNLPGDDGDTPLCTAAMNKSADLIPILLAHGADVNLPGAYNTTPLHYALTVGFMGSPTTEMISQLASPKNVNMIDDWNRSPFQKAMHNNLHSIGLLLLKQGADPSTVMNFRMELTLNELCILAVRRAMHVISDETLTRLPLPRTILEQMNMCGIVDHFDHFLTMNHNTSKRWV
jgi:ankyrin repeat protein